MNAKALAVTVAGLGAVLVGAGGTVVLTLAWLVGAVELGVLFWTLPLIAVGGLALATYGITRIATGVFSEADGLSDLTTEVNWRRVKQYLD